MTPKKRTPSVIELLRQDYEKFQRSGRKPVSDGTHLETCLICGHKAPRATMQDMGIDVKHGGVRMFRCHGCEPGSANWTAYIKGKPEYEGWYKIFSKVREDSENED